MPTARYSALVERDAKAVWSVLRYFGDIQTWHPGIRTSQIEEGTPEPLVGQIRLLTLGDGSTVRERLVMLDDTALKLSYRIVTSTLPVQNYLADICVLPLTGQQRCVVTWSASFEVIQDSLHHSTTIQQFFEQGHASLANYLDKTAARISDHNALTLGQAIADGTIAPVPLDKVYRLVNHGPTVLVSARHSGQQNVMAAAWACGLDFDPPKITLVVDKIAATRKLVLDSGYFALQIPTVKQLQMTYDVGNSSLASSPNKLSECGVTLMDAPGHDLPLVTGCSAWLVCKLIDEPHNQEAYDLFIGEVIDAWADTRVFREGHWQFEQAPDSLRSLHYIAGGQFYSIGAGLTAETTKKP